MRLINLGCGSQFHTDWINVDLVSSSPEVRGYDIRKNIPYADREFDACYSSHVIEHFQQSEAEIFLSECHRILKPNGIIRIVVPDLESIVRAYLIYLEKAEAGITEADSNYDWMMLELYDQTVRTVSGGGMATFLLDPNIANKEFIVNRIGNESQNYWCPPISQRSLLEKIISKKPEQLLKNLRASIAKILICIVSGKETTKAFEEALFRNSGEIHKWMYDRYSMKRLLQKTGFSKIEIRQADESSIPNFNTYQLDTIDGKIRKPDSLFIEGIKL
jgi:ubiquinone/menaquinone biosynthesis C-methylase UbiE